jgi:hypothetical protein
MVQGLWLSQVWADACNMGTDLPPLYNQSRSTPSSPASAQLPPSPGIRFDPLLRPRVLGRSPIRRPMLRPDMARLAASAFAAAVAAANWGPAVEKE